MSNKVKPGQLWGSTVPDCTWKNTIKSVHDGKHKGCRFVGPHVHYEPGGPADYDMLCHFTNGYYKLLKDADETLGTKAANWLRGVADMIEEKNKAYGDSLGSPIRMFTTVDPVQLVLARAEDKLSRIARGSSAGEDPVKDLVGYLALAVAMGWRKET